MTPQLFFAKYSAVLQRQMHFIIDFYQHQTGYEAQDHLIAREGQIQFDAIRADATPELLVKLTEEHPQLKAIFSDQQKARTFFEELLSDPNEERPGEEDPEAEGEAADA